MVSHQFGDEEQFAPELTAGDPEFLELSVTVFGTDFWFCARLDHDWRDNLRQAVCDCLDYEVSLLTVGHLTFDGDRRVLDELAEAAPNRHGPARNAGR